MFYLQDMKGFLFLPVLYFLVFMNCQTQAQEEDPVLPVLQTLAPISAEQAGLAQDSIDKLLNLISTIEIPDFRSLVVIKDGGLLIESYYNTYWSETIHDIRSAGKSITALCMGIAIDRGFIKSENEPVYSFFPEVEVPAVRRQKNGDITIKDLMMMSSGLDADTDDPSSAGFEGNWIGLDDWVTYVLNLDKVFEAGSRWVYNDAGPMLCSAIIQKTTGMSMAKFAEEHLFKPLGIREYYWYKSRKGITAGMGNLYITNLAFAKFGQLVLQKGKWGNRQIVSSAWIEKMTSPLIEVSENGPRADGYGFFWYLGHKDNNGMRIDYLFGTGNGGNKIYVVPSKEMVIAVQSSSYGTGRGHGQADYILTFLLRSLEGN